MFPTRGPRWERRPRAVGASSGCQPKTIDAGTNHRGESLINELLRENMRVRDKPDGGWEHETGDVVRCPPIFQVPPAR